MVVYFDWTEWGKAAIACNACGKMWSETKKSEDTAEYEVHEAERIANKNGWLILEEKNHHICVECAKKMVDMSYGYRINE